MDVRLAQWLPTALISIAIGAVGQLLLKLAARSGATLAIGHGGLLASLLRLAANPYMWLGALCFVSSMLLWVRVLNYAQLSTAYPLVSLGYVLVAVLSVVVLGEHLSLKQMGAIAVIILGVFLLGQR
jgi:multidrug transporter EmrE-like cation transporter